MKKLKIKLYIFSIVCSKIETLESSNGIITPDIEQKE